MREERKKIIDKIKEFIKSGKDKEVWKTLSSLNDHQIAHLIDEADDEVKGVIINSLDPLRAGDILFELSSLSRHQVIKEIRKKKFQEIMEKITAKGDIFLSDVLNIPVIDEEGNRIGRLYDFKIDFGEMFPEVTAVVIEKGKRYYVLRWEDVKMFTKKFIIAQCSAFNLKEYAFPQLDILARRDILDKQIVDIDGIKVVRVNDLKLGEWKNNLFIIASEVGPAGIIRRLKLEWLVSLFKIKLRHKLVPWNLFKPLEPKISHLTLSITNEMIKKMHPSDLADIIEKIPEMQRISFIESLPAPLVADIIEELEPVYQAGIIENLKGENAKRIIQELEPDKAADIIEHLDEKTASKMFSLMREEDIQDVEDLLKHPSNTAGGLMTTEYVEIPSGISVKEAIERVKEQAEEVENLYYIYVVKNNKLIGVTSLRELLIADEDSKVSDIMITNIKHCAPDTHYREIGEMLSTYNLVAIPVVDMENNILGVVTVDDILEKVFPSSK